MHAVCIQATHQLQREFPNLNAHYEATLQDSDNTKLFSCNEPKINRINPEINGMKSEIDGIKSEINGTKPEIDGSGMKPQATF